MLNLRMRAPSRTGSMTQNSRETARRRLHEFVAPVTPNVEHGKHNMRRTSFPAEFAGNMRSTHSNRPLEWYRYTRRSLRRVEPMMGLMTESWRRDHEAEFLYMTITSCEKRGSCSPSSRTMYACTSCFLVKEGLTRSTDVGLGEHDPFKIAAAKYLLLRKYEHVVFPWKGMTPTDSKWHDFVCQISRWLRDVPASDGRKRARMAYFHSQLGKIYEGPGTSKRNRPS